MSMWATNKTWTKPGYKNLCLVVLLVLLTWTSFGNKQVRQVLVFGGSNDGRQTTTGNSTATKVLISAYFRGGSSFVGEAFNQNDDVFYWFEPLVTISQKEGEWVYQVTNATYRYASHIEMANKMQVLANILQCRLELLHPGYAQAFNTRSRKLQAYAECMKSNKARHIPTESCLHLAINACKNAKIVAIKTIRFNLYMLNDLLTLVPGLHVIMYTRDPRGTLTARQNINRSNRSVTINNTQVIPICRRMHDDLKWYAEVSKWKNVTVFNVKYEDLAARTPATINLMYGRLGVAVPQRVLEYFTNITHADVEQTRMMQIKKRNSTDTALKWRSVMNESQIQQFNQIRHCSDVVRTLGYD